MKQILIILIIIFNAKLFSQEKSNILDQNEILCVSNQTIEIPYSLNKDSSPINRVELWVSTDGGNQWEIAKIDSDLRPPVTYTAKKDGLYSFYVLQFSDVRNKPQAPNKDTAPSYIVILDTKRPELILHSMDQRIFKPGGEVPISWTLADLHLSSNPIEIEVSVDNGKTWNKNHQQLKDQPVKIKAPNSATNGFMYKVIAVDKANNKMEAISEKLYIDPTYPIAEIVGPKISNKPSFPLEIKMWDEGKSGIKYLELYFSYDDGLIWKNYLKELDPKKPLNFTPPEKGKVGLFLVAIDAAGNRSPSPIQSTKPQWYVTFDDIAPKIKFIRPDAFASIGGNSKLQIQWESSDENIKENSVYIYYSTDAKNTWKLITSNESTTGSFFWTVPSINYKDCSLKLVVSDELNNFGEALLGFNFEIDSKAPLSKTMYVIQKEEVKNIGDNDKNKPTEEKNVKATFESDLSELNSLKEDHQYSLAMDKIQDIISRYPDNAMVYYEYAKLLSLSTDQSNLNSNKAINALEKAISLKNDYEAAYILRGSIYYKKYTTELNEKQKIHYLLLSEHEYLNAIKILGDNYEEFSNLGIIYFRLERYEEATKNLLRATLLNQKPSVCYWYLARIEEIQGNYEKAEKYWRKAAASFGVNTTHGEKAVLNAESSKSKKIGQQILE